MIPVEDYAFQCIPPLSKCYKKYYLIIPPKLLLSTKSQNVIAIKSLLEKDWTPGIGPSSRHAIITDFVTDCLLFFVTYLQLLCTCIRMHVFCRLQKPRMCRLGSYLRPGSLVLSYRPLIDEATLGPGHCFV